MYLIIINACIVSVRSLAVWLFSRSRRATAMPTLIKAENVCVDHQIFAIGRAYLNIHSMPQRIYACISIVVGRIHRHGDWSNVEHDAMRTCFDEF